MFKLVKKSLNIHKLEQFGVPNRAYYILAILENHAHFAYNLFLGNGSSILSVH